MSAIESTPRPLNLGDRIRDRVTHIEGIYLAHTEWHDRSDEVAIQRDGLNGEGEAFQLHWCPVSRVERAA